MVNLVKNSVNLPNCPRRPILGAATVIHGLHTLELCAIPIFTGEVFSYNDGTKLRTGHTSLQGKSHRSGASPILLPSSPRCYEKNLLGKVLIVKVLPIIRLDGLNLTSWPV